MSSVMMLPPELLLEIFQYLPAEELLDNVQHVCTKWRELVRHPSLWEDFVYKSDMTSNLWYEEVVEFMVKCPMLKHIHSYITSFFAPEGPEEIVNAAIKNCNDMRTFCVELDWPSIFTHTQFSLLLEAFPNLEYFLFTVDGPESFQVVDRISKSTKLKKLIVNGEYYSDGLFRPICDGCIALNHLSITNVVLPEIEQLYILQNMRDRLSYVEFCESQPATDQVVEVLGTFTKLETVRLTHKSGTVNYLPLGNIKTLKCLIFRSFSSNMSNYDSIFEVLFFYPFPLLQKLTISPDRTILKEICLHYPKLKYLHLHNSSNSLRETFRDIDKLEQLENLIFPVSKTVMNDDAKYIAECHKLKHLDLNSCRELTDKTVASLANCKLLESLDLSYCSLTEQSLHLVSEHLKHLKVLRFVNIEASIEDQTIFAEKMPWLKIHF